MGIDRDFDSLKSETGYYYQVSARDWDAALQARFGKENESIILTDDEVISAIAEFGRASIKIQEDHRELKFDNDYD